MGSRVIRGKRSSGTLRKTENRVLTAIVAAVGIPFALACILVAADMRSDLSDLKPARVPADPATAVIGWPELSRIGAWDHRPRTRMLGYMMDGYTPSKDGTMVEMFMLQPEAGQIMHAAHREPDQMVEVWLTHPMPFTWRRLTWVSGDLHRLPRTEVAAKALYAMKDATAELASERDITNWFVP